MASQDESKVALPPDVNPTNKPVFLTKKQREELALQRLEQKRLDDQVKKKQMEEQYQKFATGKIIEERKALERKKLEEEIKEKERRMKEENIDMAEHEHELKSIRKHYLGKIDEEPEKEVKKTKAEKNGKIFKFEWDAVEDTGREDLNPLYSQRYKINALFGRGYIAGVDQKEQRKNSNFLLSLGEKRIQEMKSVEESQEQFLTEEEKQIRRIAREKALQEFRRSQMLSLESKSADDKLLGKHWSEKPLGDMTERDWRIFREDFDIRVQGGRAPLPLRYWNEANFPQSIYKAIVEAGYEKPSPIQRQAIPIGMAHKDIIGIAETGSGKTCAFLVPMLCYLLKLPTQFLARVAEEGPLSIILAPTRELAQQIEEECIKLNKFTDFKTACIVGGQSIEEQGFKLRRGVEIVVGTPGRILDCIKSHYMVLNQCNYVIMDEADRMIDMGFEEQVVEVLNSMGGLLKSEDEYVAEQQLQNAQLGNGLYRVTAMFSATMPPEVELIAKKYLRHPVTVRIGDVDSGKNKRIEQHVIYLSDSQKKGKLTEELRKLSEDDKVIIFVNEKRTCDSICWHVESLKYNAGALHGGKGQDQREETLESFRSNKIQILVATDVAGRGLDIPDVSHVINFDCPNKIQNYCHRIGRTGRAGKFGTATTFLTDKDTEIMFDLKQYLEQTDSPVPHQLAHHPAAQAAAGTRDDKGRLVASKREGTQFVQ
jgi:ATP-dependent RNA helicase DDX23/PRP28